MILAAFSKKRKGMIEMDFNHTRKINIDIDREREVHEIIQHVYEALKVKGYDPISQIVGYLISGDPTYITSYNNARYLISRIERDELLEELVRAYVERK